MKCEWHDNIKIIMYGVSGVADTYGVYKHELIVIDWPTHFRF